MLLNNTDLITVNIINKLNKLNDGKREQKKNLTAVWK